MTLLERAKRGTRSMPSPAVVEHDQEHGDDSATWVTDTAALGAIALALDKIAGEDEHATESASRESLDRVRRLTIRAATSSRSLRRS
jgi:hypothetical protein